jgi:hypothetical protein
MPTDPINPPAFGQRRLVSFSALSLLSLSLFPVAARAQRYPVTAEQRATADQVAQAGVPVSELAANAPETYVVKGGDTLWDISGVFLNKPWRWPALWGMNRQEIQNPNLIYPGQTLYLIRQNGLARLSMTSAASSDEAPTIRVSPRSRYDSLTDNALPTLRNRLIEPFLAEPVIVDEKALFLAPHIVAAAEGRVLIGDGERAYARGATGSPLLMGPKLPREFRVFRNATPIKDPNDGAVLGYEAQFLGRAKLQRGESTQTAPGNEKPRRKVDTGSVSDNDYPVAPPTAPSTEIIPATIDIVAIKEEIRAGDRLLPEPERQLNRYVPHAPEARILKGRIASIYGSAVANAAQNQVVALNLGSRDGIESGHVMAILTDGERLVDTVNDERVTVKLPDERNGLLMVFRTFDRVSYALILEIKQAVRVGDRVINPL